MAESIGKTIRYFNILEAKRAYQDGTNVIELLRNQTPDKANTSAIIELAYDLQAGSYIESTNRDKDFFSVYIEELIGLIKDHVSDGDSVLDVGTGELTTFSLLINRWPARPGRLFAFDISWSRVFVGLAYARQHMEAAFDRLEPFVADMTELPLRDKSVDVVLSHHALESNATNLPQIVGELFRVTRKTMVLFEPCYETASADAQRRMQRFGIIRDFEATIADLGGTIVRREPIRNVRNPLHPTVCFIIRPPPAESGSDIDPHRGDGVFSVPGSDFELERRGTFYVSRETGLCFPILENVPVLKSSSAILASRLE